MGWAFSTQQLQIVLFMETLVEEKAEKITVWSLKSDMVRILSMLAHLWCDQQYF